MPAVLSRIVVYPLKSGDGRAQSESRLLPTGPLEHDRQWALFDAHGRVINGKRTPLIQQIRTSLDPGTRTLTVTAPHESQTWSLDTKRGDAEAWLSDYFRMPVQLREDAVNGFPDDRESPGPTLISTATLEIVASWFPGVSVDEARRRFRANLEINGVEPFWEDRLFGPPGTTVPVRIGSLTLLGNNPCARCGVPPRQPETGETWPDFVARFRTQREQTLPTWTDRSRFDHFYRLSINTRPASTAGGHVQVGDPVELPSPGSR